MVIKLHTAYYIQRHGRHNDACYMSTTKIFCGIFLKSECYFKKIEKVSSETVLFRGEISTCTDSGFFN